MTKHEKEQSFEDWWHGDDGDEPITDVAKDRAKEIENARKRRRP